MPKRSNAFQRLVVAIEQTLAFDRAEVRESVELADSVTNTLREVDILIAGDVAGYGMRIAVECRDESRPADVSWIDALIGKYQNLPVDRVVAVARAGFTVEAERRATTARIDTLTLEQGVTADWLQRFRALRFECLSHSHELIAVRLKYPKPVTPTAWAGLPDIYRNDGTVLGNLGDLGLNLYNSEGHSRVQQHVAQKPWEALFPAGARTNSIRTRVGFDANDLHLRDAKGNRHQLHRLTLIVETTVRAFDVAVQRYAYRDAGVFIGRVTKDGGETLTIGWVVPPDGDLTRTTPIPLLDWKVRATEDS